MFVLHPFSKMEQSRFAGLCYFCAYNKKLLEILNFKNLILSL